jgi:hypothetical protein
MPFLALPGIGERGATRSFDVTDDDVLNSQSYSVPDITSAGLGWSTFFAYFVCFLPFWVSLFI